MREAANLVMIASAVARWGKTLKTWQEVMNVAAARTLVDRLRSGYVREDYRWEEPTQDAPIIVAVVDQGCQIDHPALPTPAETYSYAKRGTAKGASASEMLKSDHGTMSAGLIVGSANSDNSFLGGVAADIPGLQFWPVRYNDNVDADGDVKMYQELSGDGAHIISNSFGPEYSKSSDRSKLMLGLAALTKSTFVFAAGNGSKDMGVVDHFKDVVLVGATIPADRPEDETKVPNSNRAKGLMVCAPRWLCRGRTPHQLQKRLWLRRVRLHVSRVSDGRGRPCAHVAGKSSPHPRGPQSPFVCVRGPDPSNERHLGDQTHGASAPDTSPQFRPPTGNAATASSMGLGESTRRPP